MILAFYDRLDNDGRGSRAVTKYALSKKGLDVEFVGLNTSMKDENGDHYISILTDRLLEVNDIDRVMFLDLAPRTHLEARVVFNLLNNYGIGIGVDVIDHHKLNYSIEYVSPVELNYVHELGVSACKLSWDFFFRDTESPRIVELINDRDVWINDMQPYTNYLHNTFNMMQQAELDELVSTQSDEMLDKWLAVGEIREDLIVKKEIKEAVEAVKVIEWNGYKIAIPTTSFSSEYVSTIGNNACKEYSCDLFCSTYSKGNKWGYALRSLSGQALDFIRDNNFKGGGHINACGFTHEEKLF